MSNVCVTSSSHIFTTSSLSTPILLPSSDVRGILKSSILNIVEEPGSYSWSMTSFPWMKGNLKFNPLCYYWATCWVLIRVSIMTLTPYSIGYFFRGIRIGDIRGLVSLHLGQDNGYFAHLSYEDPRHATAQIPTTTYLHSSRHFSPTFSLPLSHTHAHARTYTLTHKLCGRYMQGVREMEQEIKRKSLILQSRWNVL